MHRILFTHMHIHTHTHTYMHVRTSAFVYTQMHFSPTVVLLRCVTRSSATSLDATATSRQRELQWRRCRVKTRAQQFCLGNSTHVYVLYALYNICFRTISICIPQFCHATSQAMTLVFDRQVRCHCWDFWSRVPSFDHKLQTQSPTHSQKLSMAGVALSRRCVDTSCRMW